MTTTIKKASEEESKEFQRKYYLRKAKDVHKLTDVKIEKDRLIIRMAL